MIKITIKANQIDMDVLLISKVDNIQKLCLSPKCGFFHYFIGLRILPAWTNIVPKIYRDLSALEGIILTSYLWLFLLRMICLPTACYLVNLQARFSKVDYCLTKISIRAKHSISRVFSLFIVPSPFFVHCPYKGRINLAESVLTGLKPY